MKKSVCLFLLILQVIILFSCTESARTESIENTFKKVDGTLTSSSHLLDKDAAYLLEKINAGRNKNESLAMKADAVFTASEAACHLIDSINQAQRGLDSSGEKIDITDKLLLGTSLGLHLKNSLLSVSKACYASLTDPNQKPALDSSLSWIKEIETLADWDKRYFYMTPTVAGITLLNKFRNDCKSATVYSLDLILKQVAK